MATETSMTSSSLSVEYLTLDIKSNKLVSVQIKQYTENSPQLIFTVTDNGQQILLNNNEHTVLFKMLTPDDRKILLYGTINPEDHTTTVTLTPNCCTFPGKGSAELLIFNASEETQMATMNLDVVIVNSVYPESDITGSNEFRGLANIVNDAKQLCNKALQVTETSGNIFAIEGNISTAGFNNFTIDIPSSISDSIGDYMLVGVSESYSGNANWCSYIATYDGIEYPRAELTMSSAGNSIKLYVTSTNDTSSSYKPRKTVYYRILLIKVA